MGRKVFISFLGTNNYVETIYEFADGSKSRPVRFVQEALISAECKNWTNDDKILIFCTQKAEEKNWVNNGQDKIESDIEKIGLEQRLKENYSIFNIVEKVNIPEGFSEKEIWSIFDIVYGKLEPHDEVYFDVTHAFRSIPLFSTILFNFSRFMIETDVISIKYGAFEKLGASFEVKKLPIEKRIAPIVDLTDIVHLQTLTRIADDFKTYGKTSGVGSIFETTNNDKQFNRLVLNLKNGTSKLEEYILLKRVEQIQKGDFVDTINSGIRNIRKTNSLKQSQEIVLEEIEKSLSSFKVNGGDNNIVAAISWALKFNMIQQAYTLAQEYLISLATKKYKDKCFYSEIDDSIKWRNYMSSIMGLNSRDVKEKNFKHELAENLELTEYFFSLPEIKEIRTKYSIIANNRNILSHGKKSDLSLEKFKKQLENNFNDAFMLLTNCSGLHNGLSLRITSKNN